MRNGKVNESKDEQRQKVMAPSVHHHHHKAKPWAPGTQKVCEALTEMRYLLFLLSFKMLSRVYPRKCCFKILILFVLLIHRAQATCPHTLTNVLADRLADAALTFRPVGPSMGSTLNTSPVFK